MQTKRWGAGKGMFFPMLALLLSVFYFLFLTGCSPGPTENGQQGMNRLEENEKSIQERADQSVEVQAEEEAAIFSPGALEDQAEKVYPQPFSPAPDFMLTDLEGETRELDDFCGVPLILIFWTDDCPRCLQAILLLETLSRSDQGIEIIGISDLPAETVKQYMEVNDLSFTMLLDPAKEAFASYLVEETPTAVAIHAQGTTSVTFKGFFNAETIETMRRRVLHQWELDPIIK